VHTDDLEICARRKAESGCRVGASRHNTRKSLQRPSVVQAHSDQIIVRSGLLAAFAGNNTAFAQGFLAGQLAGAADGFSLFARPFLGRLFKVAAQLHFTEDAFALHLLFQRLERLVYIVVAYNYMHRQIPRVGVKTVQIKCWESRMLLLTEEQKLPAGQANA